MTELSDKIQNALDEGRILILGAEVLLGALFRATFDTGYGNLSVVSRYLTLAALFLTIFALALLISAPAYHNIVDRAADQEHFNVFLLKLMKFALLPFATSL